LQGARRPRGYVSTPEIAFPIGLGRSKHDGQWFNISIFHSDAHAVLYNATTDENLKKNIREAYVGRFANKAYAADRFDGAVQSTHWKLQSTNIDALDKSHFVYGNFGEGRLPVAAAASSASIEIHIDRCIEKWTKVSKSEYDREPAEFFILGRNTPGIDINFDEFLDIDPRMKQFIVEYSDTSDFGGPLVHSIRPTQSIPW
jgi:hypothetical protein